MPFTALAVAAALLTAHVDHTLDPLTASGPAAPYEHQLMDFGRFVGKWSMKVSIYGPDGTVQNQHRAFWQFAWILQGRAIQDVFISEPQPATKSGKASPGEYGSTIRMYRPATDDWNVAYLGPRNGQFVTFVAHRDQDAVVLERTEPDGEQTRWVFDRVTFRSFRWRAISSRDAGQSWRLDETMEGRRLPAGASGRRFATDTK